MDADSLIDQARAARKKGDVAAALALYRRALDLSPSDLTVRAHCQRHIGDLAYEAGDLDAARVALQEAEMLCRGRPDDPLPLANTLRLLAIIEREPARWREARLLYARAAEETGLPLADALAECDRALAPDRGD